MKTLSDTDVRTRSPFQNSENVERLVNFHGLGRSLTWLAGAFGVTPTAVAYQLKKAGVRIPKKKVMNYEMRDWLAKHGK